MEYLEFHLKESFYPNFEEEVLTFINKDKKKEYTISEMGLSIDLDKVLEDSYKYGGEGDRKKRLEEIGKSVSEGLDLKGYMYVEDEDLFNKIYDELNEEFSIKKVEPVYTYEDAKIKGEKGKDGTLVDKEGLLKKINENLNEIEVLIIDDKSKDLVDLDSLNDNLETVASSTTYFSGADSGRVYNMELAVKHINNMIINPGETFSFLGSVGTFGEGTEYVDAGVIVDGDFVTGVGGGVCQVSTTTYQAALKSGMEIVERHNHGRPIGYSPLATDAMVSDPWSDFRFKNPYDFPIVIKGIIEGDSITMSILADKTKTHDVTYESVVTEEIPTPVKKVLNKDLKEGEEKEVQEGWPGYRAVLYVYDNTSEESYLAHEDYYPERTKIVEYNPKKEKKEEDKKESKEESKEGSEGEKEDRDNSEDQ